MPPFSGKKKKEQLKARRQQKREVSQRAHERERALEHALDAGEDGESTVEALLAEVDEAVPRGRHALRRQRLAAQQSDSATGESRADAYDHENEYKYGADRKGVRSVFKKESKADIDARRALNYSPLAQRITITANGVPFGSWFVLAGEEAVTTTAKKKKAQREAEKAAARAAVVAAAAAAEHAGAEPHNDGDAERESKRDVTTEGGHDVEAAAQAQGPALVGHIGPTAVSTTFPFSVELPSRGWRLNELTGELEPTYTVTADRVIADELAKQQQQQTQQQKRNALPDGSSDGDEEDKGTSEVSESGSELADKEKGTRHSAVSSDSSSSSSMTSDEEDASPAQADNAAIDVAERRCFQHYCRVLDDYPLPDVLTGLQINAYERNLDVWRQLWRTVEVSDVAILVTDARYPIMHTSIALLRYITVTQKKPCLVILNKSDLVPAHVLQGWTGFLTEFFSRVGLRVESDAVVLSGEAHRRQQMEEAKEDVGRASPIVLVPFTAQPRGEQSAIDGITDHVDVAKRLRKKEKRRAKLYEQLRTGRAHFDAASNENENEASDDEATYHSGVNFKGMKQVEHTMQQEKREHKELQVVANAITAILALCRALVPEAKAGAARAASEAHKRTVDATTDTNDDTKMKISHLPSAPPTKRKRKNKKNTKRSLLPHGGVAPPSGSDDDDDEDGGGGGVEDSRTGEARHGRGDVLHDRDVDQDAYVHIGFVGFPNVGKSSLLNCIRGTKVVSVSATPGHTKHLQTIPIPAEGVTLVDSPGLAFPCFGIPPMLQAIVGTHQIAQTRDPQSGVAYLASYLPLETIYGLQKPDGAVEEDPWTPYDLCEAYAKKRGFFVKHGKGALDVHRGAIALLQEAYEGRLAFFFAPPELNLLKAKYFESTVLPLLDLAVLHPS